MMRDPRAGILCTACNAPIPTPARPHCESPTCTWTRCARCRADNDAQGNNSVVTALGVRKDGRA